MFKNLLVPTTGLDIDAASMRAAVAIARLAGAHLDIFHLRHDTANLVQAALLGAPEAPVFLPPALVDEWKRQADAAERRARTFFADFCAEERIPIAAAPSPGNIVCASWRDPPGDIEAFAAAARCHDLSVAAVSGNEFDPLLTAVEAALMGSGQPILVVPEKRPVTLGTIVVAWKDTAESARAISSAMPLLAKASRILVFTVGEGNDTGESSFDDLIAHLRWHGMEVSGKCLADAGKPAPQLLFETAAWEGAGLVVMGGYGHSRARELLFGGFTKYALRQDVLPVFLAH